MHMHSSRGTPREMQLGTEKHIHRSWWDGADVGGDRGLIRTLLDAASAHKVVYEQLR